MTDTLRGYFDGTTVGSGTGMVDTVSGRRAGPRGIILP